jgi:hypothetical protein
MENLADFYSGTTMQFIIYPQSQDPATYTLQATSSSALWLTTSATGAPSPVTINLNNLTTLDLFGGDVGTWLAGTVFDPDNANVWYTEIAKFLSAVYNAGLLPIPPTLAQPVQNRDTYFTNYRGDYFSNPESCPDHGPWYNLYDSILHPLMIQTGGYGLGYGYDFDDLLALGGEMHVNIQSTAGVQNPAAPYYTITMGPVDTAIPEPTNSFGPFNLTVNPISATSYPINIIYSTTSGSAPSITQAVPQNSTQLQINTLYDYFLVEYYADTPDPNLTYKVYPKHQLVIPSTTRYNTQDASLISNVAFISVENEGQNIEISLPNLFTAP